MRCSGFHIGRSPLANQAPTTESQPIHRTQQLPGSALKIPMTSFQLAGSLVLLLFGLKLVLGQVSEEAAAMPPNATLLERAIYPLAIPCIAGAGSMLTVVLLTDNDVRSLGEQALTTGLLALCL